MLTWYFKRFEQLTTAELYAILKARQDVFIIEQTCLYKDIDGLDSQCLHLFCTEESNHSILNIKNKTEASTSVINILAYSRIIPPNIQYNEASIGRVLTTIDGRQRGLGKTLISKAIEEIHQAFPAQPIKISAQYYLLTFYQSFGFEQISDIYLDDDIEHIDMRLTP